MDKAVFAQRVRVEFWVHVVDEEKAFDIDIQTFRAAVEDEIEDILVPAQLNLSEVEIVLDPGAAGSRFWHPTESVTSRPALVIEGLATKLSN